TVSIAAYSSESMNHPDSSWAATTRRTSVNNELAASDGRAGELCASATVDQVTETDAPIQARVRRMARSMETEHMLDQPCDTFACPSPVGRLTAPATPERSRASDQARRFGLARRGGAMGDSDSSTEHHGGQTAA